MAVGIARTEGGAEESGPFVGGSGPPLSLQANPKAGELSWEQGSQPQHQAGAGIGRKNTQCGTKGHRSAGSSIEGETPGGVPGFSTLLWILARGEGFISRLFFQLPSARSRTQTGWASCRRAGQRSDVITKIQLKILMSLKYCSLVLLLSCQLIFAATRCLFPAFDVVCYSEPELIRVQQSTSGARRKDGRSSAGFNCPALAPRGAGGRENTAFKQETVLVLTW